MSNLLNVSETFHQSKQGIYVPIFEDVCTYSFLSKEVNYLLKLAVYDDETSLYTRMEWQAVLQVS